MAFLLIGSPLLFASLLLSGCVIGKRFVKPAGKLAEKQVVRHVIDERTKRIVRRSMKSAARDGTEAAKKEFDKLLHENQTFLAFAKERGIETLRECLVKEALRAAFKDTRLSKIQEKDCFGV